MMIIRVIKLSMWLLSCFMSKVASMKAERARWVLDPNNQDQRTVGLASRRESFVSTKKEEKEQKHHHQQVASELFRVNTSLSRESLERLRSTTAHRKNLIKSDH